MYNKPRFVIQLRQPDKAANAMSITAFFLLCYDSTDFIASEEALATHKVINNLN
jgi:hypothetical protein